MYVHACMCAYILYHSWSMVSVSYGPKNIPRYIMYCKYIGNTAACMHVFMLAVMIEATKSVYE